ncbi:MAG: ABC transporter ATP-binding protein [Desulfurococcales archaeon]|nr:ABC transporter ATP-binding protein [Desulfurococcales archaeon]
MEGEGILHETDSSLGGKGLRYAAILREVSKSFKNMKALRNLTLKVPQGKVFGLIGPNGAGKTTTLRILATLVRHDSGYVEVLGMELPKMRVEVRKRIAYLPEDAGLYGRLTGWENLLYYAMIYAGKRRAEEVAMKGAEISGLSEEDLNRKAHEYSKGMSRRVAIARALMLEADLTILDEPTSGLDVVSSYSIRETIKDYVKRTGKAVIFTSHNLLEVEEVCDEVALIHQGRILDSGSASSLKSNYRARNLEEVFIKALGLAEA